MKENVIIRVITKLLVPFIQLFGFYVIMHGESGPGGGFQGGVILGASVILYVIVFGIDEGRKLISEKINDILNSTGVLIYGGVGLLCIIAGGKYLEYNILPLGSAHFASHMGMLGIEIGVGVTVSAVMITLFFETARQGK
jgi:multicomponent Na+:H+ antiporter subunit B